MAQTAYRVFLSHSSKDKEFVKELYRRLKRDGVACFFDIESIGWGANWVTALERAIDECEHIVFVLSPDFCLSEWSEVERTSAIADDPGGLKRKLRPLMLGECRHLPAFPRFLKHVQTIDVSTDSQFEQNYPRICHKLGGLLQEDFAFADRTRLPPVHPLPARHRMPYRSLGEKFVGRIDAIWELRDSLFRDSTTVVEGTGVVAGTGGLGKTQLAIEYAHRFGATYTGGVYWVEAERGILAMIAEIGDAADIEVNPKVDEGEQAAQLWRALNSRNLPVLVILDNFPENAALSPYLATTGRLHTIVTTRRQDLGNATVRLPVLSLAEGARLLNSGARQFGESAKPLAERLGGLPLALELAKSYLNYRRVLSVEALIEEMNSEGEVAMLAEFASQYRDQLPSRHERDVVATFQLSWKIASEPAKQVLRAMGELAPAAVPCKFLRTILGFPAESAVRDPVSKAVAELSRLSLVDVDTAGDPAAHRLILAFVRHRNVLDAATPFEKCREALDAEMRKAFDNPGASRIRELETLLPHAEFLASSDRLSREELGSLSNSVAKHHKTMGRFTAARDAFRQSLASYEKSFEPGHHEIATIQSNLALVLKDLGQLDEARDLLRKALASYENLLEPGHANIATVQANLAIVLKELGQLAEARDLLRQALASNEKSFDPGHPLIAITQSNLAMVLKDLGQLDEARDLLRKALASYENLLEPGHANIAITQSNLALVLKDLGQSEEARDLLRQALASYENFLEPGHANIATVQSNLAIVLQDLGQLEEARDLLRQALASDEKSFEPGHPSIARSQSNLATVLQDLGQLEEARDLLRQAYTASLERYGPEYPATKVIKANLINLPEPIS